MHLMKPVGSHEYAYKYFFLDVAGHPRIYLENADVTTKKGDEKQGLKMFGVKWN